MSQQHRPDSDIATARATQHQGGRWCSVMLKRRLCCWLICDINDHESSTPSIGCAPVARINHPEAEVRA